MTTRDVPIWAVADILIRAVADILIRVMGLTYHLFSCLLYLQFSNTTPSPAHASTSPEPLVLINCTLEGELGSVPVRYYEIANNLY